MTTQQSENEHESEDMWRRKVLNRFINQIKEIAEELEKQGREQESVDLLFRCGVVSGMAMSSLRDKIGILND